MSEFTKGDKVTWSSHGGEAVGEVLTKITEDTEEAGRTVRASEDEPQYPSCAARRAVARRCTRRPHSERDDACPKRMHYGPCGGVRDDGGCEMRPHPVRSRRSTPPPPWAGSPAPPRQAPEPPPSSSPTSALPAYDPAAVAEIVDVLAPTCDAVLVGEHQNRPDLPPTLMAALIKERRCAAVDHVDLPRPQPGRAGAGAARLGRAGRGRGVLRHR